MFLSTSSKFQGPFIRQMSNDLLLLQRCKKSSHKFLRYFSQKLCFVDDLDSDWLLSEIYGIFDRLQVDE